MGSPLAQSDGRGRAHMADTKRDARDEATGVGPGITGGSGDFISSTGGDHGIGGTGHEDERDAAGARPDERQNPSPQELMEEGEDRATTTRVSAGKTGTIGGGGPHSEPRTEDSGPGNPGGGGSGAIRSSRTDPGARRWDDVPGGIRRVKE